jgi:hypothetical protein
MSRTEEMDHVNEWLQMFFRRKGRKSVRREKVFEK